MHGFAPGSGAHVALTRGATCRHGSAVGGRPVAVNGAVHLGVYRGEGVSLADRGEPGGARSTRAPSQAEVIGNNRRKSAQTIGGCEAQLRRWGPREAGMFVEILADVVRKIGQKCEIMVSGKASFWGYILCIRACDFFGSLREMYAFEATT